MKHQIPAHHLQRGEGNKVGAGRELKSLEDLRDTKSENISDFLFRGSAGRWRTCVFLSVKCMTVVVELLAPPRDSYLEGQPTNVGFCWVFIIVGPGNPFPAFHGNSFTYLYLNPTKMNVTRTFQESSLPGWCEETTILNQCSETPKPCTILEHSDKKINCLSRLPSWVLCVKEAEIHHSHCRWILFWNCCSVCALYLNGYGTFCKDPERHQHGLRPVPYSLQNLLPVVLVGLSSLIFLEWG